MKRAILLVLAALAAAGCRTTTVERPRSAARGDLVERLDAAKGWTLQSGEDVLGSVVLFRSTGGSGASFYSVRNPWQQELGMIDSLGRAWRYRPHEPEPEWIGSGSVAQGARWILSAPDDAALRTADLAALAPAGLASTPQ